MHYDYMVHIKIRHLFFKQNRVGVMELCAASLRFTANRLGQMSWLVKCARRGGAAGPVVFVQFYDTHHPSYQQNCIPYWLH